MRTFPATPHTHTLTYCWFQFAHSVVAVFYSFFVLLLFVCLSVWCSRERAYLRFSLRQIEQFHKILSSFVSSSTHIALALSSSYCWSKCNRFSLRYTDYLCFSFHFIFIHSFVRFIHLCVLLMMATNGLPFNLAYMCVSHICNLHCCLMYNLRITFPDKNLRSIRDFRIYFFNKLCGLQSIIFAIFQVYL